MTIENHNKKPKSSDFMKMIEESVQTAMRTSGWPAQTPAKSPQATTVTKTSSVVMSVAKKGKAMLKEALVVVPKSFPLKTEKLSSKTKEAHEQLYHKYIEAFNKISSAIDSANKEEASENNSAYRSLKVDESYNLNAIKLHEMYFHNISDLASEITVDSIPYIKLARFYGTFETWQLDFIACCMASREGWAMTVFDPYNNTYSNVIVDGNAKNIPVGSIPVIVMDMGTHAYYADYLTDKKSYVINMMREFNWNVIEARMTILEQCSALSAVYKVAPIYNDSPNVMLNNYSAQAEPTPIQATNDNGTNMTQLQKQQAQPLQNPTTTNLSALQR